MLAIGKSAWSAKESKYIGVHCPLAITQGRISESLLSSCREAKKDLPNKKIDRMLDIDCFYTSWNWNVDVLLCHASVCFFLEQFFESMDLSAGSHFFFAGHEGLGRVVCIRPAGYGWWKFSGSSISMIYDDICIYICTIFNGNFRILKWRYVSSLIFLAIFCGDIPLLRPEK